jgi:DNA-binding NarL/FixJ family response regulator
MSMITSKSVWLVAQHAMDRYAYRSLLTHELGQTVYGESDFTFNQVIEAIKQHPDIFVFLAETPTPSVRVALSMVREVPASKSLVVVIANANIQLLEQWVRCPMDGIVTRDSQHEQFWAAFEAIENHQRPYIADDVKEMLIARNETSEDIPELSVREVELLPLLAQGLSLRTAASKMGVSYKTADSYRTSLLKKLGLRDRVALSLYATREGIITP